ncbi:MAG TPA: DegV family protein [Bacillota bacterium]|nr:DegV family protein [Bacillota bacterium]HPP60533.1 DegV family protein [Bacillota bacterium]HPV13233.1 DegV family protein [Bacillota bacterium]
MSDIAVVTDSTSDIGTELAKQLDITVIPLSIIYRGVVYKDGVDLTPSEFYPMLEEAGDGELPTSSQPSPQEFLDIYKPLIDSGKEILSFHISKGLSGTVDAAKVAASQLAPDRIHVVDTQSISFGIAGQAIEAARLAKEGFSAQEILQKVSEIKDQSEVLFSLDTLYYLERGGRIGKVSSVVGSLLKIKPIVRVEDGIYVPLAKVRSMKQAISGMVEFLQGKFKKNKVSIAVGHGQGLEYAQSLLELALEKLNVKDRPSLFEVGPVIGVHTGPGTVGIYARPARS